MQRLIQRNDVQTCKHAVTCYLAVRLYVVTSSSETQQLIEGSSMTGPMFVWAISTPPTESTDEQHAYTTLLSGTKPLFYFSVNFCKENVDFKYCLRKVTNLPTMAALRREVEPVAWIWRKIWGSGSVRSNHQTVSGASKISSTFHFVTSFSPLMMWNLQSYPTTVLNERMWHFMRSLHTLTPLHIFRGSRLSTSGSTPPSRIKSWLLIGLIRGVAYYSWSTAVILNKTWNYRIFCRLLLINGLALTFLNFELKFDNIKYCSNKDRQNYSWGQLLNTRSFREFTGA